MNSPVFFFFFFFFFFSLEFCTVSLTCLNFTSQGALVLGFSVARRQLEDDDKVRKIENKKLTQFKERLQVRRASANIDPRLLQSAMDTVREKAKKSKKVSSLRDDIQSEIRRHSLMGAKVVPTGTNLSSAGPQPAMMGAVQRTLSLRRDSGSLEHEKKSNENDKKHKHRHKHHHKQHKHHHKHHQHNKDNDDGENDVGHNDSAGKHEERRDSDGKHHKHHKHHKHRKHSKHKKQSQQKQSDEEIAAPTVHRILSIKKEDIDNGRKRKESLPSLSLNKPQ